MSLKVKGTFQTRPTECVRLWPRRIWWVDWILIRGAELSVNPRNTTAIVIVQLADEPLNPESGESGTT